MQHFSARHKKGFTLVELLVVVAIIGVMTIPLLLTYRSYRTSQALVASVQGVVNHARSAHIFSREARDQREWGVRSAGPTGYAIFSSGTVGKVDEQSYFLEPGVVFSQDFEILFKIGTGETDKDYNIELVNANGRVAQITIGQAGIVEALPI